MQIRRFLDKLAKGSPAERADIVRALVRVYLEVPLDADNRIAAATALTAILDDPAPRVRRSMAEALADSGKAPAVVVRALAADQPDIARIVLSRSPVLGDAELVDLVATGCPRTQAAIASRREVGVGLSAAIAEVADADACLELLDNPGASIGMSGLRRMVERHRGVAAVRNTLLEREDLPVTLRQQLVDGLTDALGELVLLRDWLPAERARRVVDDARDRAIVEIALSCGPQRLRPLVEMLAAEGRITPALLVRALSLGNGAFLEEALSVMARMPARRVAALIEDRSGRGLAALFRRAKLPCEALPALRAVIDVLREEAPDGTWRHQARMGSRMLERALTRHQSFASGEVDELFGLLSRLAAEAAREDARSETGGYFRAA